MNENPESPSLQLDPSADDIDIGRVRRAYGNDIVSRVEKTMIPEDAYRRLSELYAD